MDQQPEISIRWRNCILYSHADSPTVGASYFVLTRRYFGWSSQPGFLFRRAKFHVIPLTAIDRVEVVCKSWALPTQIRIFWDGGKERPDVLEMIVYGPYLWVNAFRRLAVPVVGAEKATLGTFRGFLNNYGMWLWLVLVGMGGFALAGIGSHLYPQQSMHFWGLTCAFMPLVYMLPHVWALCRHGYP
jgi:hypothetical protein